MRVSPRADRPAEIWVRRREGRLKIHILRVPAILCIIASALLSPASPFGTPSAHASLGNLLTLASSVAGLNLLWPVNPENRLQLTNDYAEFNAVGNHRHHTGIDIATFPGNVLAVAAGNIVKIQENDVGCNPAIPGNCEDHGYGHTVIIRHEVGSSTVYSQYSHLGSIEEGLKTACGPIDAGRRNRRTCTTPVPANQGTILGSVGCTRFGRSDCGADFGAHLHLELKDFPYLGTRGDDAGEPDGGGFGYTTNHPDKHGFHDPVLQLHQVSSIGGVRVRVTAEGQGVSLRVGPRDYRLVRVVNSGEEFIAFEVNLATASPLCSHWWYQVRPTELSQQIDPVSGIWYFRDPPLSPGVLPDAWLCRGNSDQVWLEPISPQQTFVDVPSTDWGYQWAEEIYRRAITAGCAPNPLRYCPDNQVTRREMAVFVIKSKGLSACIGCAQTFSDVIPADWGFGWVELMFRQGLTAGCASNPLRYCPDNNTTRREMAVFLMKARGLTPCTTCAQHFSDVPPTDWGFGWIERLFQQGVTAGCYFNPITGERRYCPNDNTSRREMAVFLVRTFPNFGGRWVGTWQSTVYLGVSGTFEGNLVQSGSTFTGAITGTGSVLGSAGSVSGTLSGNEINFGIIDVFGNVAVNFTGTLAGNGAVGKYSVPSALDLGIWQGMRQR